MNPLDYPPKSAELALLFSAVRFPGRVTLYLSEVAKAAGCTVQEVVAHIEAGRMGAVIVKGGPYLPGVTNVNPNMLRVPAGAYEEFLKARAANE